MKNLLTRNYIFLSMIFLTIIFTYISKHDIVVIYFPFVIFSLIYMLFHRQKFVINKSVAIFLLIVIWSFISSIWAVKGSKGISISLNLLLFIVAFQVLYWLSSYAKVSNESAESSESNESNNQDKPKFYFVVRLSVFIDKYGYKFLTFVAYAIVITSLLMIIDSMIGGKISLILFHKPTTYKNQSWYEGAQTLTSGILGGVATLLYKRKNLKLALSMIFIALASIITNYFYTGYAGIIIAIPVMIIIAIFPRKISFWIFAVCITLYYLLFPTFFGLLYDSPLMKIINAHSPESLLDRYVIWEYAHILIDKNWLFGYGAHSSRYLKAIMSQDLVRYGVLNGQIMDHFTPHPHNLVSQIWVEYGLFGVLAYCLFIITLLKKIFSESLPKYATILLMMSFTIVTAIQNAAWGMWESWFMVSITLSLGFSNFVITYLEHNHRESNKEN